MGERHQKHSIANQGEKTSDESSLRLEGHDAAARYDRSRYGSGASRGKSQSKSRARSEGHSYRRAVPKAFNRKTYNDSFYDHLKISENMPADDPPEPDDAKPQTRISSGIGGKRILPIAVCVVAVLMLAGAGAAFAYVNAISDNLHEGVSQDLRDALVHTDMAKEPFYMLLLGTDGSVERDDDAELAGVYRSDSMMLARIDGTSKKVTLISINRDTIVDLGEYGEQKINAAYSLGGAPLAVDAVSKLAGVGISHFAQVDFDGFSALVDSLGGVEVEVPVDIDDWEAGGAVDAGLQSLNGQQALIVCRSRNTYADIAAHPDEMRAANQRLVLSAIAKKLLSSDVATIAGSVRVLSQYVTTDLEISDIIGLAQAMQGLDPSTDIYTAMEPTISEYVDETWCEYINKNAWTEMMKRVNKGLPPTEGTVVDEMTGTVLATSGEIAPEGESVKHASITVKNGTDIQGLAAKTRTKLMDAGFETVIIGDIAEGYQYPMTLVVYADAAGAHEAEQIAEIVGQGSTFLNDGSYLLPDTDFLVIIGEDWIV